MRDLDTFFYKTYNKSEGLYREERQDFEGLLIFLHMKMSAKSNKIELSEEFMATWREEQTPLGCHFPIASKQK